MGVERARPRRPAPPTVKACEPRHGFRELLRRRLRGIEQRELHLAGGGGLGGDGEGGDRVARRMRLEVEEQQRPPGAHVARGCGRPQGTAVRARVGQGQLEGEGLGLAAAGEQGGAQGLEDTREDEGERLEAVHRPVQLQPGVERFGRRRGHQGVPVFAAGRAARAAVRRGRGARRGPAAAATARSPRQRRPQRWSSSRRSGARPRAERGSGRSAAASPPAATTRGPFAAICPRARTRVAVRVKARATLASMPRARAAPRSERAEVPRVLEGAAEAGEVEQQRALVHLLDPRGEGAAQVEERLRRRQGP